jgi:hypothetical protein
VRDPGAGEMQHDHRKKVGSDLYVSPSLRCQFAARLSLSRRDSAAPACDRFVSFIFGLRPPTNLFSLLLAVLRIFRCLLPRFHAVPNSKV